MWLLKENFVVSLCVHANAYPHQRFDKTNLYTAQTVLVIHHHNANKMRTFSCFILENRKNEKGSGTFSCGPFFVVELLYTRPRDIGGSRWSPHGGQCTSALVFTAHSCVFLGQVCHQNMQCLHLAQEGNKTDKSFYQGF